MPTKLEQARDLLANRLEELDGEREQLVAAIAQLDKAAKGSTLKPAARSSSRRSRSNGASKTRTSRGTRRKRAPRGERESQLISSIKSNPDFRVSEHARAVGVKPQQLYPILNRLSSEKRIVKKDDRYVISA
jgi:DNA-binding NtrC family response regulator